MTFMNANKSLQEFTKVITGVLLCYVIVMNPI